MNADMRGAAEPQAKRNISPRRHGGTEKSQSNSQKLKVKTSTQRIKRKLLRARRAEENPECEN